MSGPAKTGSSIKKISGGKLVRVDVVYSKHVERVKITGDFFLHPEELIIEIEESLAGADIPIIKSVLVERVEAILSHHDAILIGFSPDDLITVLMDTIQ